MVIVFVLLLGVIGLTMALALYSSFLPYFSLLKDVKDYNMAYYGAVTSIERSLLVLRQQDPGFEAQGGWNNNIINNVLSDNNNNNFSYFNQKNYINRNIRSRSSNGLIPISGMGNSNTYNLLSGTRDYNILSYGQIQTIPLEVDNTDSQHSYVRDNTFEKFDGSEIELKIKIPSSIRDEFFNQGMTPEETLLCGNEISCDIDGDGVSDDIVVGWSINGIYSQMGVPYDFSILPRNIVGTVTAAGDLIVFNQDESIRENDVNNMTDGSGYVLFTNNISPLYSSLRTQQKTGHLLIGSDFLFSDIGLDEYNFSDIFPLDEVEQVKLKLSLNNKLISNLNQIYPYLEYRITADDLSLSQPFFYIQGESKVGDYTVKMNVVKAIDKKNIIDSFTVIF